jgi:hypothetical protein
MRSKLTVPVVALLLLSSTARGDINNCVMQLSPLEHDYGDLTRDRQTFITTPQGKVAQLSERRSNLSVTCPEKALMRLRFTGDSHADGSFRFGSKGRLNVTIGEAVLDGNPMLLTRTTPQGDAVAASHSLRAADEIIPGNSSVQGHNLNLTLTITPYLAGAAFVVPDTQLQEELIHIELLNTQ